MLNYAVTRFSIVVEHLYISRDCEYSAVVLKLTVADKDSQ